MSRFFLQEEVNFEFAIVNAISSHSASIIFLNHAINVFFALKKLSMKVSLDLMYITKITSSRNLGYLSGVIT